MQITQLRRAINPRHARTMDTTELRAEFLIDDLFQADTVHLTYSQCDRMIDGGAVPKSGALTIDTVKETGTPSWLDRCEAVLVNIGEPVSSAADGTTHQLGRCDMLHLGMGSDPVTVSGADARFYIVSAPTHRAIPGRLVTINDAAHVPLGGRDTSNERVIYQFVHPAVMGSCQIVMGMTRLGKGSVWNTMSAHRHERRSGAHLYLDLPKDHTIIHLMGGPDETRHLILRDEQAVLSPPWSIHCGAGTSFYSFIWAMAGDNIDYKNVDMVAMEDLR